MNAKKITALKRGGFEIVITSNSIEELLSLAVLSGASPNIVRQLDGDMNFEVNKLRPDFQDILYDAKRMIKEKPTKNFTSHTFY